MTHPFVVGEASFAPGAVSFIRHYLYYGELEVGLYFFICMCLWANAYLPKWLIASNISTLP